MLSTTWWTLSLSLALGAMLSLANASYADENDNRDRNQNAGDDQNRDSQNRDNQNDDATHHAALGVSLRDSDGRVIVIAVMPGSPAAKAGLRAGDEVRSVDDERVRSARELTNEISEHKPGSQVDLAIRRNGEKQTVKATLGSENAAFYTRERREQMGYSYGNNDRQSNGRQNAASQRQLRQRLQSIQQQVSRLQQEIDNLQASLGEAGGNQTRSGNRQAGYYSGQPSYYDNGQQGQMLDRTGEGASTARGVSRDHGPRETTTGNTANED